MKAYLPTMPPQPTPDEELLAELRELAAALDQPPTVADVREQAAYSHTTYYNRFGSFPAALEAAGIEPDPVSFRLGPDQFDDDEALLADLERLAEELERRPTCSDVTEHGRFGVSTYRSRFGSFTAALEKVGYDIDPNPPVSREELVAALQELAAEIGEPPGVVDNREQGSYSWSAYYREFGSWPAALEAAGCPDE